MEQNYNFTKIESKWQKYWEEKDLFKKTEDENKEKFYLLEMFPYPSGKLMASTPAPISRDRSIRITADTCPLTHFLPQALQALPLEFMGPANALVRGVKVFSPQWGQS